MAKITSPAIALIPKDSDEMFVDIELFGIFYKASSPEHQAGAMLGLGINIFLFDVNACEFK